MPRCWSSPASAGTFPDGTEAMRDVDLRPVDRASSSPSSARPVAASRRCCGSPPACDPRPAARRSSRAARLRLPGPDPAAVAHGASATSSCWPSCTGMRKAERRPRVDRGDRPGRAHRLREALPAVAVGRHADAGVAGPLARAASRTCSCSTSRSAPSTRSPGSASTRRCCALFVSEGFAGAVHHPLGHRGRVPVHPGVRDVAAAGPDRRRVRRARSPIRAILSCAIRTSSARSPARSRTAPGRAGGSDL